MIIDTNILIAYLAGEEKIVQFLDYYRGQGGFLFLPTIVETELLSFDGWTAKEEKEVDDFLRENFISVPFDRTIARKAAQLRKDLKIKLPDAGIAATALIKNNPLMTRNIKDFKKIKDLEIIEL